MVYKIVFYAYLPKIRFKVGSGVGSGFFFIAEPDPHPWKKIFDHHPWFWGGYPFFTWNMTWMPSLLPSWTGPSARRRWAWTRLPSRRSRRSRDPAAKRSPMGPSTELFIFEYMCTVQYPRGPCNTGKKEFITNEDAWFVAFKIHFMVKFFFFPQGFILISFFPNSIPKKPQ